ncbi:MAG: fatty acid CoA ligase family protein [Desulfobulbaceae bacterium]|nr:fatty acid CoA ligase family protein [Desulfobulbaceae bacterium]
MSNIAASLLKVARESPDGVALICKSGSGWQRWTFRQLENNVACFAEFLRGEGVVPGDRVMLMVRPSMEFICLTFALFALGAVVILIDPGMGYRNLLSCIGSVKPAVLVGIPRAQLFARLFRAPFKTVRRTICVGTGFGLLGKELPCPGKSTRQLALTPTQADDLAAIIFTTGSTGPPKGVRYEHRIFQAQLQQIREYYQIGAGDVDQPAFPLFALFSIALGARAVIPDMDPTRPAQVDPQKFIQSIDEFKVTYSFGSPAIWNVISRFCQERELRLGSLRKVLMAGAPVSGELIERMHAVLPVDAEIHIPYGATESLPIVSICGREVLTETWGLTRQGRGACVGRPLPGIEVRVIALREGAIGPFDPAEGSDLPGGVRWLPPFEVGEIIVRGPVVTAAYDNNDAENQMAKIIDGDGFWHRVGDLGYVDDVGRLWFCGRKAHRVTTANGTLYTICCEAIFNNHPQVLRSALVGVGGAGRMRPVVIVEPQGRVEDAPKLFAELREMALQHEQTAGIVDFLIHKSFPVDIRHNAKIFREKLASWAERRL